LLVFINMNTTAAFSIHNLSQVEVMELSTVDIGIDDRHISLSYRNESAGDKGAISQIFHNQDYRVNNWFQGRRFIEYYIDATSHSKGLIVDAGANIGAATVYFLELYPNSYVYAIEPEPDNFSLLTLNTSSYDSKHLFQGAIAGEDGELYLDDPGHSDWGFRTSKIFDTKCNINRVKSISPNTILAEHHQYIPMIFKIDIEGGEQSLFSNDTRWMQKFPLLIIELHDWMLPFSGSSKTFIKAVSEYDFDILYRGENIFLFNRAILTVASPPRDA